eukprot:TRINITY_DN9929_c0_g1_i2.p1 TRINITY_DN9929_c0_g1~~TRINITY_DN9929_c0_g1_i2.p1  ORF type:complete len:386 (-),score=55.55 TRINITY_DN9929_c0_g1_i2:307-1431(-)
MCIRDRFNVHHFSAFSVLGSLFCDPLTGSTSFNKLDPDIVCGSNDHWKLIKPAMIGGILWLVGLPIHMTYFIHKVQKIRFASMMSYVIQKKLLKKEGNPVGTILQVGIASSLVIATKSKEEEEEKGDEKKKVSPVLSIFELSTPAVSADSSRHSSRKITMERPERVQSDWEYFQNYKKATREIKGDIDEDEKDEKKEERWKRKTDKLLVFSRDFKPQWRAWYLVILVRKTVFPLAIMASDRTNNTAQAGSMLFLVALFYFLSERCKPFWLKRFNNLDTLASEIIIVNITLTELIFPGEWIINTVSAIAGLVFQCIFYLKTLQLFIRIHKEERLLKFEKSEQQRSNKMQKFNCRKGNFVFGSVLSFLLFYVALVY